MRVFVTGATGAIGQPLVPLLIEAGHQVGALARSDEKADQLRAAGAEPVRVSLFDEPALRIALEGHDAVTNLATRIPPLREAVRKRAWLENDRIRREGSQVVVDAALAARVGRLVQESITFAYPDRGDDWITEDVAVEAGPSLGSVLVAEEQTARFAGTGATGVVLRFGAFYGAGSHHTEAMVALARRHVGAVVGTPSGYMSSIHLADAASAVVAALEAPSGTYNVVDDEPMRKREVAAALGRAVGRRPWIHVPGRLAGLSPSAAAVRRSQRVSNRRFRDATGWAPQYTSVRDGVAAVLGTEVVA